MNLFIAIPVFNEAKGIKKTLNSLLAMKDQDYDVVFCDNNSTDNSKQIIEDFIRQHDLGWDIVTEFQKGTGAAADTAMRHCIGLGATHVARTDADCIPDKKWVSNIKTIFKLTNLEFIAGDILPRTDDVQLTKSQIFMMTKAVPFAAWFGKVRPSNLGKQFKGPYVMTAGCNLAITSELYEATGGFTRTAIEDNHEDHTLINEIRRITPNYALRKDVLVYCSARRIQKWGIIRSLAWYADHLYKPNVIDIR